MLNWFARRLKETQEKDKTGQGGFTLIELLVVVIIIGILAAIAIPAFLGQRQRAFNADAESTARNASTAAQTYFVDNQSYTGLTENALRAVQPNLPTDAEQPVMNLSGVTATTYTITTYHANGNRTFTANQDGITDVDGIPAAPTP